MRVLIAVFLLIAVIFVSTEAKRVARCVVGDENTHCRYAKKCVRGEQRCEEHKTVEVCTARDANGACTNQEQRNQCIRHKRVCLEMRAVKRCYIKKHKYTLRGPKHCPAGSAMVIKREGTVLRRRCKRNVVMRTNVPTKTCTSYVDPHTTMLDGKSVEWQHVGDFVMAETSDHVFAVHQRLTRFAATWTGTTGIAVMVNGRDVVEYSVGNKCQINGKAVNLADGQQMELPEGGYIKKAGQTFSAFSPNGAHVDMLDYGQFANVVVYLPTDIPVKGYCTDTKNDYWLKNTAGGLFQFRQKINFVPGSVKKRHFSNNQKTNARRLCRAQGFTGERLKNCILDVLYTRGHPHMRKNFIRIEKHIKRHIRHGKLRRINKFRRIIKARRIIARHHSHHRRHHSVRRQIVFRRHHSHHSVRRPVFVRRHSHHSFRRPVAHHSFRRPVEHHSFRRPVEHHSFRRQVYVARGGPQRVRRH